MEALSDTQIFAHEAMHEIPDKERNAQAAKKRADLKTPPLTAKKKPTSAASESLFFLMGDGKSTLLSNAAFLVRTAKSCKVEGLPFTCRKRQHGGRQNAECCEVNWRSLPDSPQDSPRVERPSLGAIPAAAGLNSFSLSPLQSGPNCRWLQASTARRLVAPLATGS